MALGVIQLTIPYLLYARAIRRVRALDALLISMIEPILNPVWVNVRGGGTSHAGGPLRAVVSS